MSDEELRALAEKATPGPWATFEQHGRDYTDEGWSEVGVASQTNTALALTWTVGHEDNDRAEEDAAYIVAACNAVPGLLDRLARVEALVEDYPFPTNLDLADLRAALSEPTTRTTDPEESTR